MNNNEEKRSGPYEGMKPAAGGDRSELDPFEIEFLPEYRHGRGPRAPFVNDYGVVIGDHNYESDESPLEQWSENTDPAVMSGDQWVHPYKDIGFRTGENRELFERGLRPFSGVFMHPTNQASVSDEAYTEYSGDPDDEFFPVPEVLDEP